MDQISSDRCMLDLRFLI